MVFLPTFEEVAEAEEEGVGEAERDFKAANLRFFCEGLGEQERGVSV